MRIRKPRSHEVGAGAAGLALAAVVGAALLHGDTKVEGRALPVAGAVPTATASGHNLAPSTNAVPAPTAEAPAATPAAPAPAPAAPTPKRERNHDVPGVDYQLPVLGQNIQALYNKSILTEEVPGTAQEGIELRATYPLANKAKLVVSERSTILADPTLLNKASVSQQLSRGSDFSITFTKGVNAPPTAWNAKCTDEKGNNLTITAGSQIKIGDGPVVNDPDRAQQLLTDMAVATEGIVGQALAVVPGSMPFKMPDEGFCGQFIK